MAEESVLLNVVWAGSVPYNKKGKGRQRRGVTAKHGKKNLLLGRECLSGARRVNFGNQELGPN